MKKILLSLMLIGVFAVTKAQVVLNELYAYPNGSNSEFIELYNSGADIDMDCFTIVSYWSDGHGAKGWYVLDLPSIQLANADFLVIGPANTISVQGTAGVPVDVNWNSLAAGGFLKLYTVSGGGYTISSPANVTDFLVEGDFAPSQNTLTFLYQNGKLINSFWGGGPSGTLPATITSMPDLSVTGATSCSTILPADGDFSTFTAVEFKNQAGGSDNGYARKFDGKCGSWVKTSSQANHTPGLPNGSASGQTGLLTTSELIICNVAQGKSAVRFTISAFTDPITLNDDFPVNVQVYADFDATNTIGAGNGILDQYDILIETKSLAGLGNDSVWFSPAKQPVIVAYRTKRGCFDKVVAVPNSCIVLPVKFNSFTAARNHSNVVLKWETAFEQNNKGFAVERNIRGIWEQVSFVASQAADGNSGSPLAYLFVDLNDVNGITQYRLRQVDLDAKSSFSEIRAVRGEGQTGKTVVFPNPSLDGRVSVVFEDATVTRDVSLSDMAGRILKQWKGVTNNNIQIDNLIPGMYSLKIVVPATGIQSVEKIIVSKR